MGWINHIIIGLFVWLLLIVYIASWGLFWQTGTFVGKQVFIFLAPHPLQVFHWVDFDMAFSIVAAAGAAAFVLTVMIPRWAASRSSIFQITWIRICSRAIAVFALGALLGVIYRQGGDRESTRVGIVYAKIQENLSGPWSFAFAELLKKTGNSTEGLSLDKRIQILQRPLMPVDQYTTWARQKPHHRWNVVLLTVESLRADQLRAYGSQRDVMPTVNKLATEARVFLNTYSQSSHTNYATIVPLSSHYPLRAATAYSYPKNPAYPRVLIYDLLKALGYRTAIFSSSNETWGGMNNYLETGNLDRFIHAANSKKPTYLMAGDAGFAIWARESKHAGSLDDRTTIDEAIEWIDGLGNDPFFVAINFSEQPSPLSDPAGLSASLWPGETRLHHSFRPVPKGQGPNRQGRLRG